MGEDALGNVYYRCVTPGTEDGLGRRWRGQEEHSGGGRKQRLSVGVWPATSHALAPTRPPLSDQRELVLGPPPLVTSTHARPTTLVLACLTLSLSARPLRSTHACTPAGGTRAAASIARSGARCSGCPNTCTMTPRRVVDSGSLGRGWGLGCTCYVVAFLRCGGCVGYGDGGCWVGMGQGC